MGENEDSAWVFDSLVGFLQGPIWSAPLLTFVEEKSLVFDAETEDSEEYRQIYQEYKNLVDLLLGSYMEDMGITSEQFEHACSLNKDTKMPVQFQHSLFEQIWAANEYEIFKRMMIQKNLELQLQALNLIEQKFGITPASLMPRTETPQDEIAMEELLRKQILAEATDDDSELDSDEAIQEEHRRLTSRYQMESELLAKALRESAESSLTTRQQDIDDMPNHVEPFPMASGPLQPRKPGTLTPISTKGINMPKMPKTNLSSSTSVNLQTEAKNNNADETEMKKRQLYLQNQRDKLVALKKEVRSQRLRTNSDRPGSAREVAEASMMGNNKELELTQISEPSKIQVRKALAARLKAEVVRN